MMQEADESVDGGPSMPGSKVLRKMGNRLAEAMFKGKKVDTTIAKISSAVASSSQAGAPV